ncbi:MAG TPA: HAD family acid phosphatase [Anaerolineales bacterium]|nr:HAD family acid phosphatase [Anaerolineales bacterium]
MADEIVIFDIDGTLADVSERIHHLRKKPKNWKAFFGGMAQDKAIHSMVRLCNVLHAAGIEIILCSGRSEEHRDETTKWLAEQGVNYHDLLLRKDHDRRSDTLVKREMLAAIDKSKVLFVVEDRSRVVEMWRSEGLVCLQCAPGEF